MGKEILLYIGIVCIVASAIFIGIGFALNNRGK